MLHIQYYIGSIVFPKLLTNEHAKSWNVDPAEKDTFYEWIYKYSHTKLLRLFKIKPIAIIYEYFYNQAMELALCSEPAIVKNREVYKEAFDNFRGAFKNEIDPAILI